MIALTIATIINTALLLYIVFQKQVKPYVEEHHKNHDRGKIAVIESASRKPVYETNEQKHQREMSEAMRNQGKDKGDIL